MAFGAAAIVAAALAVLVVGVIAMAGRASVTNPAPDGGVADIETIIDGEKSATAGIDWDYWLTVNPDIVGWIRIPGTHIDYPIVQAPEGDPDFYLTHDVYGAFNPFGSVYLDSGCNGLEAAGNSVIFAHHVNESAMFGLLARYTDEEWALDHSRILIIEPDNDVHVLAVQAADVIPGDEAAKRTGFDGKGDLMAYWRARYEPCDMKLAADAAETDHIYTFVTCSYNFWPENERTLTYAIEQ